MGNIESGAGLPVASANQRAMNYMRSKANVLWLSGVVGGAGGLGGARAHDVDVNAVYAAHGLNCEADTAVNIVGLTEV